MRQCIGQVFAFQKNPHGDDNACRNMDVYNMTIRNTASRPQILKSGWLFCGQYFPVFGLVSVSLPVKSIDFSFHVAII